MHLKPVITAISPTTADANGTSFTITVIGSNFDATSLVYWNGSPLSTVVISVGSLTATIQPANIPKGGQYSVQVYTPPSEPFESDGGASNLVTFSASMTVAEAQEYMCDLVDGKRATIVAGFFTYSGTQWACDYESTRNLIGVNILSMLNGGNLPPGITWRDYYNNNHDNVTGAFMGGMAASMLTFGTIAYQVSWYHKTNIRALTSTAAVLAYDFSGVWPDPNVQH